MTKSEYLDNLICSKVQEELRDEIDTSEWWWIPTEDNWRLTWLGYASFVELDVESWDFDFDIKEIPPWIYLKLSRNLKIPYYIVDNKKHNRLVVFDNRSAVMINLYGNLIRWIRTLN
jgi:hypothetical protein